VSQKSEKSIKKPEGCQIVLSRTGKNKPSQLKVDGSQENTYNDNNSSYFNLVPLQNQYKIKVDDPTSSNSFFKQG